VAQFAGALAAAALVSWLMPLKQAKSVTPQAAAISLVSNQN
jgi:glycerol uptake facilitator-like aquaporin